VVLPFDEDCSSTYRVLLFSKHPVLVIDWLYFHPNLLILRDLNPISAFMSWHSLFTLHQIMDFFWIQNLPTDDNSLAWCFALYKFRVGNKSWNPFLLSWHKLDSRTYETKRWKVEEKYILHENSRKWFDEDSLLERGRKKNLSECGSRLYWSWHAIWIDYPICPSNLFINHYWSSNLDVEFQLFDEVITNFKLLFALWCPRGFLPLKLFHFESFNSHSPHGAR